MRTKLGQLIQEYSSCDMIHEFAGTHTFKQAVMCRYTNKFGNEVYCKHQWCVRRSALQVMYNNLSSKRDKIANAKDFEDLYKIVEGESVQYIGDLTKYDIALRIGYLQSPQILPQKFVYLHAGPAKAANALRRQGLLGKLEHTMELSTFEFLDELKTLDRKEHSIPEFATHAMIVEDFLCVKHTEIERL